MRDTLTLAAAAATNSRKQGVLAGTVGRIGDVVVFPIKMAQAVMAYSLSLVDRALTEIMIVAGLRSRKPVARQSGGSGNGSARAKGKGLADGYAR